MNYIGNAFSLNMLLHLDDDEFVLVRVRKVAPTEVPADATSAIGHADTARVVSGILEREVPTNRINVILTKSDVWC